MRFIDVETKDALHKVGRKGLPYNYDLNIFRGCSHGCKYCYATNSHKYLGDVEFDKDIYIKTNIVERLEEKISSPKWEKQIINLGGVCDSYQHAERKYKIMPEILKLMIKYENPIIISTKSDLILRDIDLIDELAQKTYVSIAVGITSIDDKVSKKVEPGASTPKERFEVLKQFQKTNAYTGLHLFPILPILADDEETLETIVRWAKEAEVSYMMSAMLYMKGGIKNQYMEFIRSEFPEYYERYQKLYKLYGANKEYKTKIHTFIRKMREKYGVDNNYSKYLPKDKVTQLKLDI